MTDAVDGLPRLDGRVVAITGATAGLGRYTARLLAQLGAHVVIVGRSASKIRAAEKEIRRAAPTARVHGMVADLSAQSDVRRLAAQMIADVPRLDVLINNAGVVTRDRQETVDGLEMQFAVNHLAPFLLTNLLITRLADSAPSRVVTVASQMEKGGAIDFDDLQGRCNYDSVRAYRQTKLANILFTRELARRVATSGITPVSLHPGVYATRLVDNIYGWSTLVTTLRGRGLPGPDQGAAVLAHAATSPDLDGMPGVHLHERTIAEPTDQARDPELAQRLWEESARLTGLA